MLHDDMFEKLDDVFENGTAALPDEMRYRFADVGLFTEEEAEKLDDLALLVAQYLERPNPPRPLCLAVFGAPGSGKSRLVKRLPKLLSSAEATLAPITEINLTQVTSLDNLANAIDEARLLAGGKVPFVFFDEFDAKRDGAPWGWLSWFLAPMQDGAYFRAGVRRELKRGVYVFAGGTASSYEEFVRAERDAFAFAKGPDFISRLRGYLNVPGVNADTDRGLRRAAVFHHQLKDYKKKVDAPLRKALLHVGRYKHGARSIEALIELMPRKEQAVSIDDIGEHPLLGMHVDRGPLDPATIGGWIGLSGSDVLAENERYKEIVEAVSEVLFLDGATLASGGRANEAGVTRQLEHVVKALPRRLEPEPPGNPWIVFSRESGEPGDERIQILAPPPVREEDCPEGLNTDNKARWMQALKLFRMRHQLALRSVAQFAVGGRLDSPEFPGAKRYPGVVEELMLALAMRHPVYISGALGGGARWAGELLGLGDSWTGLSSDFDREWLEIPPANAAAFRPPPLNELPLTREELVAFFRRHALGSPGWVDNGLSAAENRELFGAKDVKRLTELVRRGLRTRFSPRIQTVKV